MTSAELGHGTDRPATQAVPSGKINFAESRMRALNQSFRQIVNITLIRSDQFERVGRGKYAVK